MAWPPRHVLVCLLVLPSAFHSDRPLRVPALAVLATAALHYLRMINRPLRVLTILAALASAPFAARKYGGTIAMLFFNEWIFLQGWRRVLARRMDVRWQQERSSRRNLPEEVRP
jgi:hypothetical protein